VGEIYPDETSEFWMSPGIDAEEQKKIQTTVYRYRRRICRKGRDLRIPHGGAVEECGAARATRLQAGIRTSLRRYFEGARALQKDGGKFPDPILKLAWSYNESGPRLHWRLVLKKLTEDRGWMWKIRQRSAS